MSFSLKKYFALFLLAIFTMSCEEPKNEPFTGLKKRISVLPIESIDFPLPGNRPVNISKGLRELLEITISQGDRYRIDRHAPESAAMLDLSNFNLADDLSPMVERPQYYILVDVISFELAAFSGTIYVGYRNGTVITPNIAPGASVRVDVARMDLAISIMDPYRVEPVFPTQRLTELNATVIINVNMTFSGIPAGIDLVFNPPIRLALEKLLKRGMSRIDPLLEPEPMEARILPTPPPGDGIVIVNAGTQDANVTEGMRAEVLRQTFLYDSAGKFQGSFEEPYGYVDILTSGNQASRGEVTITDRTRPWVVKPWDLVRFHRTSPPKSEILVGGSNVE